MLKCGKQFVFVPQPAAGTSQVDSQTDRQTAYLFGLYTMCVLWRSGHAGHAGIPPALNYKIMCARVRTIAMIVSNVMYVCIYEY